MPLRASLMCFGRRFLDICLMMYVWHVAFSDSRVLCVSIRCFFVWCGLSFPKSSCFCSFLGLFLFLSCVRYYCLLCGWVIGLVVHCCCSCWVNALNSACFGSPLRSFCCVSFVFLCPHACRIAFRRSCDRYCRGNRLHCHFVPPG